VGFVGKRYVMRTDEHGQPQLVEVPTDYNSAPRPHGSLRSEGEQYDGLRTTEGIDISSRKKRREYMKANNVTDPSDYKRGYWEKSAQERAKHFSGQVDTSGGRRKETLARAMDAARHGRKFF
jgi:hypothetical protein